MTFRDRLLFGARICFNTADAGSGAAGAGDAGAAGAAGAGSGAGDQSAAFDWSKVSGIDAARLGTIQNKQWKDPGALLDSYVNLERLAKAPPEQIVRLPQADTPEAWNEVYSKLGRPAEAKDYSFKVPEGADPKFADAAKGWFHKHGLSSRQAAGVVEEWNAYVAGQNEAVTNATKQTDTEQVASLKTEWGGAFDANVALVDKAADAFGMTDQELAALKSSMGAAGAMKFMHRIGSKLGVGDGMITGERGTAGSALTPAQALAKISDLRNDSEFTKRFVAGDVTAKAEMERLHRFAYP